MNSCSWIVVVGVVVGALACKAQRNGVGPIASAQRVETLEVSKGGAASTSPSASARVTGGIATGTPDTTPQTARCLDEKGVREYDSFGFKLLGPMGVVRVAQDDTLNLRENPALDAPIVSKLAPDAVGIELTRQVCFLGATPWYQVRAQGKTGWVNSRYLGRVTKPRDVTSEYREHAGEGLAATPSDLVKRITTAMTTPPQTEGKYEVETVDVQVRGKVATSVLYACCELDDSVAGEQTLVTMQNRGAGWTVENAQARHLCYRGLNSDGTLCQ
ncbi:MAG TPA: SH3 domain-containing protein [Polyangiaceae bacterium]|nr:SH3 domain-containing protein [Polyangiaceae bacterium]